MKKVIVFILLCHISVGSLLAQKIGVADFEYITSKMPEYGQAQTEMNKASQQWAKDIQNRRNVLERMRRDYMAEEILLTEDLKKKRKAEIEKKEEEEQAYNNKVFGLEGLLFQKKKELMRPIVEKVQEAAQKVAIQRKLDFLMDKSSGMVLIYSNPKHDYTDYIMEELGIDIKPGNNSKVKATAQSNSPSKANGNAGEINSKPNN